MDAACEDVTAVAASGPTVAISLPGVRAPTSILFFLLEKCVNIRCAAIPPT
jgi:hypothetical protein